MVVAFAATVPALALRLAGIYPAPILTVAIFGLSILGAGFLLSWGAEAAEAVEVSFLALASLYSFAIVAKGRIELVDTDFLGAIFAGYLWRLSKIPHASDDDDDGTEVGPAATLEVFA